MVLAVALVACSTAPQTRPPVISQAGIHPIDRCVDSETYNCATGVWARVDVCDPSITNPYVFVECPTRKAEADAAISHLAQQEAANNAIAARNQADVLYCNMQAQIASANVRGILYPAAVYGQVQNTCLQMKAAERAASNY